MYHPNTGAYLGLNVREQFYFGPWNSTSWYMKKIEKVKKMVPELTVRRQVVHGSGTAKKVEPKKELGICMQSQTNPHRMRETVVLGSSDDEGVLEKRKVQECVWITNQKWTETGVVVRVHRFGIGE